jgi:hypothetical protein
MPFRRYTDGLKMNVHNIFDLGSVTPGHGDRYRQTRTLAMSKNQSIPLGQSLFGERQPAKAVAEVGVGPRQVDGQVSPRLRQRLAQTLIQGRQIGGIICAIVQLYVQVAALFVKGEVFSAVN